MWLQYQQLSRRRKSKPCGLTPLICRQCLQPQAAKLLFSGLCLPVVISKAKFEGLSLENFASLRIPCCMSRLCTVANHLPGLQAFGCVDWKAAVQSRCAVFLGKKFEGCGLNKVGSCLQSTAERDPSTAGKGCICTRRGQGECSPREHHCFFGKRRFKRRGE